MAWSNYWLSIFVRNMFKEKLQKTLKFSSVKVNFSNCISTTTEGEWRTGRWSPGGLEVKRRRSFNFWAGGLLSATGVCVWWGAFHPVWWHPPTYGRMQDFELLARKWKWILRWRQSEVFDFHTKLHESESYVDSFIFVYVCSFVWLLSSVLDKESVDSKVLVQIEIN